MKNKTNIEAINEAFELGKVYAKNDWIPKSYYTPFLKVSFMVGYNECGLGPIVNCERYGDMPSEPSYNYREDRPEIGVSVIRAGNDTKGSSGAHMFLSDRKLAQFDGMLIFGKRGSDGEPLVIPIDFEIYD